MKTTVEGDTLLELKELVKMVNELKEPTAQTFLITATTVLNINKDLVKKDSEIERYKSLYQQTLYRLQILEKRQSLTTFITYA